MTPESVTDIAIRWDREDKEFAEQIGKPLQQILLIEALERTRGLDRTHIPGMNQLPAIEPTYEWI